MTTIMILILTPIIELDKWKLFAIDLENITYLYMLIPKVIELNIFGNPNPHHIIHSRHQVGCSFR